MEIYERIWDLRKNHLKMSQSVFGKRLGVNRDVINNIENNRLARPEQKMSLYKLICSEFNVSEEWLLNGTGKMFCDFSDDEYSKAAAALSNDALIRSLLIDYWKLNDDSKKLFRDFLHRLSDDVLELENEAAQSEAPDLEKLYNEAPDTAEEFEKLFPPVEDAASDAG